MSEIFIILLLYYNYFLYIADVKTPICAVSGAQFLTRKGFLDLRNTLDADVPFNLFRDEGRTFLQVIALPCLFISRVKFILFVT